METQSTGKAGFSLIEIMLVLAIVALLLAIASPNFVKSRTSSHQTACIVNLKQIDCAKATWAMENKKATSDSPANTDLFGPTHYIREIPSCPASGTYSLNVVQTLPTCSRGTSDGHTL